MSPPGLRAAWGHPRRGHGDGCHPVILTPLARLQLLTRTGCRDLPGFRAELGHADLSRSKDAPVHNTHVKRARGALSPCPLLWGISLTPVIPLLALPPTSDLLTSHFPNEDTTSAPHLALGPVSLGVPQFPPGEGTSPAHGLSSCSGFAGAPEEGGAQFAGAGARGWRGQTGSLAGLGSPSAPRLTRGAQGGWQRASAVCRAGHQHRFHGPCRGICLPASKARHGLQLNA